MSDASVSRIAAIFGQVMERQAYLFSDPVDTGEFAAGDGAWFRASMDFAGDAPGTLTLVAGEGLAREIAANVLGVQLDDPSVEANHRDALGEIVNVVCGHMLTALHGEHAVHHLSIPALEEIGALEADDLAGRAGCLAFAIEDHQALLLVDFHPGPGRAG